MQSKECVSCERFLKIRRNCWSESSGACVQGHARPHTAHNVYTQKGRVRSCHQKKKEFRTRLLLLYHGFPQRQKLTVVIKLSAGIVAKRKDSRGKKRS